MNLHKKIFSKVFTNKFFQKIFNQIFLNRHTVVIFNQIFEKSPHIFQEAFVRLAKQPDFDFKWKIFLTNKRRVIVNVTKDYPQSFHFALSYKWHDIGLRKVEAILNDFYDKDKLYIDIGANHGLRSIYSLSLYRPTILFEPNYYLYKFILKLFADNHFKNFTLENYCLSSEESDKQFYISASSYLSSLDKENVIKDNYADNFKEIKVNLIQLDKYFEDKVINSDPKIIKIDVEGHEYEVIKGAKLIIEKYSPAIIVEIFPASKFKTKILEYFFSLNYKCFGILNRGRASLIKISKLNHNIHENISNYLFIKDLEALKNLKIRNVSRADKKQN